MNTTSKGTEQINKEGEIETMTETVDYSTQAGQEVPKKEDIHVVHLTKKGSDGDQGVLAGAAAAVVSTVKSAKDAVSGNYKDKTSD